MGLENPNDELGSNQDVAESHFETTMQAARRIYWVIVAL